MKKKIFISFAIFTVLILLFFFSLHFTFAQDWEVDYPVDPQPGSLPEYINFIYTFAFTVGAVLAVVMIIIGGIQWSTQTINPQQKAAAKDRVTKAITGLVALFVIFIVLKFINPDFLVLKDIDIQDAPDEDWVNVPGVESYDPFDSQYSFATDGDMGQAILGGKLNEKIPGIAGTYALDEYYNSENYYNYEPTKNTEKSHPCEIAGEKRPTCGSYCMGLCRRLNRLPGNGSPNPNVFGMIRYRGLGPNGLQKTMKDAGSGLDRIDCQCFASPDRTWKGAHTYKKVITTTNNIETIMTEVQKWYNENHDACYPICHKGLGYEWGYTSAISDENTIVAGGWPEWGLGVPTLGSRVYAFCTCIR